MTTYKDAGVDISEGDYFVDQLKPLVASTHTNNVLGSLAGFAALHDVSFLKEYNRPVLVTSTDGVGTKVEVARELKKLDTIGIDLVAMVVNDIVVHGATPLLFLDYYATGKLNSVDAISVMRGIIEGCKIAGCSLVGGETAEMPGVYSGSVFDLAGFGVGVVEFNDILPKKDTIIAGDIIVGIPSSGFHSNGYSLIRKVFKDNGLQFTDKILTSTAIYVVDCLKTKHLVKGFAHITGGGLIGNISRILPEKLFPNLADIDLPEIFRVIKDLGNISMKDMIDTFNCGFGMTAIIEANKVEAFNKLIPKAKIIGKVEGQSKC